MSFIAFWLILISVLLHALWHCIGKGNPSYTFFAGLAGISFVISTSLVLTLPLNYAQIPFSCFLFALGGACSGLICNIGLVNAYKRSDVSLAYPLARAFPVIFTALVTVMLQIGKTPGIPALAGMVLIAVGSFFMPMKSFSDFRLKNYTGKTMLYILLAALGTTGYTIFDGRGVQMLIASQPQAAAWCGSIAYSNMREGMLLCMMLYMSMRPSEKTVKFGPFFRKWYFYAAGISCFSAYALVLLAMNYVTNVSYVQAFRQLSLPVGVVIGVLIMHEKCPKPKLLGVSLVLLGLLLTALR